MNPFGIRIRANVFAMFAAMAACFTAHAAAAPSGLASIQMIAFAYNGAERDLMITNAEGAAMTDKTVDLPIHQFSKRVAVSSRDLVFSFMQEGKPTAVKPMTLRLPETGHDFLLVFLPLPAGQGSPYRVHAVELPMDKFKGGTFAFLNYSNAEIACVMDKDKTIVVPGKAGILTPGHTNNMIATTCYEKEEGKWSERPFFSARVPMQKGLRNLVLVSRDPASGRIGFRSVSDNVD